MQSNNRLQYRERRPANLNRRASGEDSHNSSSSLHQFDGEFMTKGFEMKPENLTMEYKDYSYPWDSRKKTTISECICGFLNSQGGTLLIGVKETAQMQKRIVKGKHYTEEQIEQLNKDVTKSAQKISPMVVANNLVQVKFVPVIDPSNSRSRKQLYVVKITVTKGWLQNLRNLYNLEGNFLFRTKNEVRCFNDPGDLYEIQTWREQSEIERKSNELKKQQIIERALQISRPIRKPPVQHQSIQTDLQILNEIRSEKDISRQSSQGIRMKLLTDRNQQRQEEEQPCVPKRLAKWWKKITNLFT